MQDNEDHSLAAENSDQSISAEAYFKFSQPKISASEDYHI